MIEVSYTNFGLLCLFAGIGFVVSVIILFLMTIVVVAAWKQIMNKPINIDMESLRKEARRHPREFGRTDIQ